MLKAEKIAPGGSSAQAPVDVVELDFQGRRRRRFAMRCIGGLEFLLDLTDVPTLHDGDGLVLEDGRIILVQAAREPLSAVRAGSGVSLVELAYHIGNRHLEAQVFPDRIHIRRDHVIDHMVENLGGHVQHVEEAFQPLAGAYGGGHRHD